MQKLLLILLTLVFVQPAAAQFLAGEKEIDNYDGFFDFHYQQSTGKVWLVVEDLDREFLYVNALSQGLGSNDIGLDRGQLGPRHVVEFRRVGPRVLMVQPNYEYRAVTSNPLEQKAVDDAFAESVLFGFQVSADGLIVTNFHVVSGFINAPESRRIEYLDQVYITKVVPTANEIDVTVLMNQHNRIFNRNRHIGHPFQL